jgi:GNAT superfamily N-acetyltransferase
MPGKMVLMSDQTRRVWRAGPATLTLVAIFTAIAAVVIPLLAYLIYRHEGTPWLSSILIVLTVAALLYAWRFGLHPKLQVTAQQIHVVNPVRRHVFDWDDVTLIAPGENGLVIGTEGAQAEAWCIQKSNSAARRGRLTRADRIAHELLDILDEHDPPLEDEETGLRIRRARPDESRLLTRLERAASEDALSHIFPPEEYPYPVNEITRRWRRLLGDRHVRVYLLELLDSPVGYVAFDSDTLLHLGVVARSTRRGFGTALLEFACREMYAGGAWEAQLWVLVDNTAAQAFYLSHRWTATQDRRRADYPPRPQEMRMVRRNPAAARRSR